jgi:hypothetical protein
MDFLHLVSKFGATYQRWTCRARHIPGTEMSHRGCRRGSKAASIRLADEVALAMIGAGKIEIRNPPLSEVVMSASNVIEFGETTHPMTYEEGLAFIERMRRQLDRFDVAVPGMSGKRMNPETEAKIRRICDELEADFKKDLGII